MKFVLPILATLTVVLAGCTNAGPAAASAYLQVDTGEPCVPDMSTMEPAALRGHRGNGNGNGGHNSPTGIPGDNIDDPHSGKVDCYYDGNSGQGDDKKHGCQAPPMCDADGCCENPDDGRAGDPPNDGLDDDNDGEDDDNDGKIDEDYTPPGDGDPNNGDPNDPSSGDGSSGDGSSGDGSSGDGSSGDGSSGDGSSGDGSSGDGSSGDGNTDPTPVIR